MARTTWAPVANQTYTNRRGASRRVLYVDPARQQVVYQNLDKTGGALLNRSTHRTFRNWLTTRKSRSHTTKEAPTA